MPMAKYGPRSRSMIHPSGSDRSAARRPPASAASGHATWSLMIRTAAVYAPTPKNVTCPNDKYPV